MVYYAFKVFLRARRIYVRPWTIALGGVFFILLSSMGVQYVLWEFSIFARAGIAVPLMWSCLIPLTLQYKLFANTKALKGITTS